MILGSFLRRSRAALCAACLLTFPALAVAQGAHQEPSFIAIGSYLLVLDGERVDADFYHSPGHGSIVFSSPELEHWVELQPRGRQLALYPADSFHRNADGSYDKLPSARPASSGTFELVGHLPKFSVEGKTVTLEQRPYLYGPQTAESIMEHDRSYRIRADAYQPTNPEFLERLKAFDQPVRVEIYFGSWCSTCVELLPHVFRVQEMLADAPLRFEYHGIHKDYSDPKAKQLDIKATPTGVLFLGDREIGRIVGHSWRYPEVALVNSLSSAGLLE